MFPNISPAQSNASDSCGASTFIDLRAGSQSNATRLFGEAGQSQLVLLGIRSDVEQHITLAGCLLEEARSGRAPVLALQALPANTQGALDSWRRDAFSDPEAFADAVQWDDDEFGDYAQYEPLVQAAANARAHVLATDAPVPGAPGSPSSDALLEVAPRYGLQTQDIVPLIEDDPLSLTCTSGLLPTNALSVQSDLNRYQIAAGRLIAGRGRGPMSVYVGERDGVRRDVAVPYLVERTDRPPSMLVIAALTEDEWERLGVSESAETLLLLAARYDYVVITEGGEATC
ncbi:MAG: ChaN family lipoprotein [Pseudomonadota bacterium]